MGNLFIGMLIGATFIILQRYLLNNIKWELVEENKLIKQIISNPILGNLSEEHVFVDIYKKTNKRTGKVKFKSIKRH